MYPSRYSNGKLVSAAQYITELICEHKAKSSKIDLHFRFWTNKRWSHFYRDQIATANKLLKIYDPKSIIKALNDPRAEKIYSLRAPHLKSIIDHHELLLQNESNVFTKPINRDIQYMSRHNQNKNIISKLKDIDNGSNT